MGKALIFIGAVAALAGLTVLAAERLGFHRLADAGTWTGWATVLLFFATVALGLIAYNQYKTTQAQTRAYVFLVGGLIMLQDNGKRVQAFVEVRNFGSTPGYDFETWSEMKILPSNADPFDELGEPKQRSIIGPGATFGVGVPSIQISEEDLKSIEAGRKRVFVWGYARYRDAFDRRWKFIFRCHNAEGAAGQHNGHSGWLLHPHIGRGYTETGVRD